MPWGLQWGDSGESEVDDALSGSPMGHNKVSSCHCGLTC